MGETLPLAETFRIMVNLTIFPRVCADFFRLRKTVRYGSVLAAVPTRMSSARDR